MQVGTYTDGRPLNYDESTHQFTVGDAQVTYADVAGYDQAGQIAWVSDDMKTWAGTVTGGMDNQSTAMEGKNLLLTSDEPQRAEGKVVHLRPDSGFIECALTSKPVRFRLDDFRGEHALCRGEVVSFDFIPDAEKPRAERLCRCGEEYRESAVVERESAVVERHLEPPQSEWLFDWAYLGYMPRVLSDLAALALPERWEFKNTEADPDHPFPILRSYLMRTFGKLVLEKKVLVNGDASYAAFNTGLVDARYEPIYALFAPSRDDGAPWKLQGFCVAAEDFLGQALVRNFNPKPAPPHYFDEPSDLLFDTRAGEIEIDWNHVVIERISRYPIEFLEDNTPAGFILEDTGEMTDGEKQEYWLRVGEAIQGDNRAYRRIINRIKDAVDLSVKRVMWNYKTAVPQYYPRTHGLQLLLPICLVSDERTDMALAVEKTPSGSYLGHTMLPLDWAYRNARLVCRPDSDWLDAGEIAEGDESDD